MPRKGRVTSFPSSFHQPESKNQVSRGATGQGAGCPSLIPHPNLCIAPSWSHQSHPQVNAKLLAGAGVLMPGAAP